MTSKGETGLYLGENLLFTVCLHTCCKDAYNNSTTFT